MDNNIGNTFSSLYGLLDDNVNSINTGTLTATDVVFENAFIDFTGATLFNFPTDGTSVFTNGQGKLTIDGFSVPIGYMNTLEGVSGPVNITSTIINQLYVVGIAQNQVVIGALSGQLSTLPSPANGIFATVNNNLTWLSGITPQLGGTGIVNASGNTLTINAPSTINQDVSTTASPIFTNLTLSGIAINDVLIAGAPITGVPTRTGVFTSVSGTTPTWTPIITSFLGGTGVSNLSANTLTINAPSTINQNVSTTVTPTFAGVATSLSGIIMTNTIPGAVPTTLNNYEETTLSGINSLSGYQLTIRKIGKKVSLSWPLINPIVNLSAFTILPSRFIPLSGTTATLGTMTNVIYTRPVTVSSGGLGTIGALTIDLSGNVKTSTAAFAALATGIVYPGCIEYNTSI